MTEQLAGWELDTGLVDDVDFTIQNASFGFDAKYQNGETLLLKLDGTVRDEAGSVSEHSQFYSCGKGWEQANGGRSARREDGNDGKNFNRSSGVGLFIRHMIEAGAADALRGKSQKDAAAYEGLTLHMKQTEIDYKGEIGVKQVFLPVKFVSVGGDSAPAQSAPEAEGLSAILRVKLIKAAKDAPSHDDFILAAYEIPGVEGNPAAEAAVVDESAIWAEANA